VKLESNINVKKGYFVHMWRPLHSAGCLHASLSICTCTLSTLTWAALACSLLLACSHSIFTTAAMICITLCTTVVTDGDLHHCVCTTIVTDSDLHQCVLTTSLLCLSGRTCLPAGAPLSRSGMAVSRAHTTMSCPLWNLWYVPAQVLQLSELCDCVQCIRTV